MDKRNKLIILQGYKENVLSHLSFYLYSIVTGGKKCIQFFINRVGRVKCSGGGVVYCMYVGRDYWI